MKKVVKSIIVIAIILISMSDITATKSIIPENINRNIELYEIKEKESVTVNTNSIIDFYKTDPNKKEYLKERMEQARLEKKLALEKRQKELQLRNSIVNFSKQFVGNPYVLGGTSLTEGADCSGFVQSVFRNFNISLPRTANAQSTAGDGVEIENIQPGDIISYGYNGTVSHSAIYIGNGQIVHASTPELGIRIDNMNIMPIITIRRVI